MKKSILKFLFFFLSIYVSSAQSDFKTKEAKIDSLMKSHIIHKGKQPVHSFILYAKNEKNDFEISKAVGTIGRNDTAIDPEYQYNIASITKTFLATIILQLEEEGKLKTSDKAIKYLKSVRFLKFDQIYLKNNISYANDITIEMLLHHTSGIADVFTDAETRFNLSVLLHRKRLYTTEMFMNRYYRYKMNEKTFNLPNEGYHYSDINYMLLGFIIEQITKQSLPQAIRERILVPLKMENTYFEYYEPEQSKGKRIDSYLKKINMTKYINTSYEWGGGGLVSTTKELGIFIQSLFNIKFFKHKKTLDKMIDISVSQKFGQHYGMGIYKWNLNNKTYYGHGGFYGSMLAYEPIDKVTFSVNIGQAIPPYDTSIVVSQLLQIITN